MAVHLAQIGRLGEKLWAIGAMVTASVVTRSVTPLKLSAADRNAVSLPYSVPLGLGTLRSPGGGWTPRLVVMQPEVQGRREWPGRACGLASGSGTRGGASRHFGAW